MNKMYAGILVIAVLFGASMYNVHYLDRKVDRLLQYVDTAGQLGRGGDFAGAERIIHEAISFWNGMDSYTHIFIRHSDIDGATDAFYDCLGSIQNGGEDSAASIEKLHARLCSILDMEHVSFGSIF